jgi:hypothetical protein
MKWTRIIEIAGSLNAGIYGIYEERTAGCPVFKRAVSCERIIEITFALPKLLAPELRLEIAASVEGSHLDLGKMAN